MGNVPMPGLSQQPQLQQQQSTIGGPSEPGDIDPSEIADGNLVRRASMASTADSSVDFL